MYQRKSTNKKIETALFLFIFFFAGVVSASDYQVNYEIQNDWGSGFIAQVTIVNNSSSAIDGWTVEWTFPDAGQSIVNAWDATFSQSGTSVTVTNASYNGYISSGGEIAFGFQGAYSSSNPIPTDITLNGQSTDDDGDDGDDDDDSDDGDDSDDSDDSDDKFSFFVMSLEKIQEWGGPEGLGGNLGGLSGADAKCQEAAEEMGSTRLWHAFLSVTDDGSGNAVNAIDRIGSGPWYDVNGLLVANNIDGLLNGKNNGMRPDGASDIVYNGDGQNWPFYECLTTEFGNCNLSYGDSHDTLTGSNMQGQLISCDDVGGSWGGGSCNATSYELTCNDWTSTSYSGTLPIGHSWNRRIGSTNQNDAHWIHAHEITGCGANINLSDSFEDGIGGEGGYGAWYCFAYD